MKNNLFALTTLLLMSATSQIQAKQTVCIFDLMGKAGESYKFMEEWALSSKTWGQMSAYFLIKMKQK